MQRKRQRRGDPVRVPNAVAASGFLDPPETGMDESLAPPATPRHSLWMRFLYMLLMGFAFYIAAWVLGLLAVVQLAMAAFAGGPNPRLQAFGAALGRYFGQLARFLTFETDDVPFPFADWPTAGS
jgi:hypothetical protein